jgi:ATP-binding cassette subfamily C (CFTR/MRP) protein 1
MADGVLLRTLYMRNYVPVLSAVITAAAGCKLVLLFLESWPKTAWIMPGFHVGRIDVASPFDRAFFWWLNPMMLYGNSNILTLSDLYPIDNDMRSEGLRIRMEHYWDKCAYKNTSS